MAPAQPWTRLRAALCAALILLVLGQMMALQTGRIDCVRYAAAALMVAAWPGGRIVSEIYSGRARTSVSLRLIRVP